jgi:hypothetical protein
MPDRRIGITASKLFRQPDKGPVFRAKNVRKTSFSGLLR